MEPVEGTNNQEGPVSTRSPQSEARTNDEGEEDSTTHVSHFRNVDAHSAIVRYGVPLWTVATLVLLINADIGSGVAVDYIIHSTQDGIQEEASLLVVSIFSSVKELWLNESYPLAILIAVTSIAWPYLKLALTFYAWFRPYQNPRKREFLVEVLDACGKWSFVDIIVLVEIMVAFRQTIVLHTDLYAEIVLRAQWGFYGFVLATMMSLISTHFVLHFHRGVHYHDDNKEIGTRSGQEQTIADSNKTDQEQADQAESNVSLSGSSKVIALLAVLISMAVYIVGVVVEVYEVTSARGDKAEITAYSVISVGQALPGTTFGGVGAGGNRFIQFMWFFLAVAIPLFCSLLFGVFYVVPMPRAWMERIFTTGEIAFAWSCAEVLLISTIFAVLQMPSFGEGLIEVGCELCFVDSRLLPPFAWLCVGGILNVGTNVWLYRKAHTLLYAS